MLALGAVPASIDAAEPAPTISVVLFDASVRGTGTPGGTVVVTLRDPGGRLIAKRAAHVGKKGNYGAPMPPMSIVPGVTIRVDDGSRATSLSVPDIRPLVDREADRVSGSAPPGSSVTITVRQGPMCCGPALKATRTVTADGTGRYRADFSAVTDIIGPNLVDVDVPIGDDLVVARGVAPWLNVNHGTSLFQGYSSIGTTFRLGIRGPDGKSRLSLRVTPEPYSGGFAGMWQDRAGRPVELRPGDRLVRSGLPDLVVPRFAFTPDPDTDTLTGRCIPNATVEVWIGGGEPVTQTDGQGRYRIMLPEGQGFGHGADWTVLCYWPEHDRYIAVGTVP